MKPNSFAALLTAMLTLRVVSICMSLIFASAASVFAQETPVASGASALRDGGYPWYDAEQDATRIVTMKKESTADDRKDWQDGPERPKWDWDWDWDWWDWGSNNAGGGGGGFRMPSFGEVLQGLGWLLLAVLLGAIVYALIRAFMNRELLDATGARTVSSSEEERTDEQRIRELPVQPTKRKGDFLSMAREAYESQQFGEAIVYLFSHRLIQLDRAGLIRLTRGKTNRQYLYELASSQAMQLILGKTISCFEDVFFGKHVLGQDRFEQTWQDNADFDQMIQDSLTRR